jgi:hypothetical protein
LQISRALRGGPRSSAALTEALGISQPTLSRTIQAMPHEVSSFRIKGARTPQYALLRQLPLGLHPKQRIYRVLSTGTIEPFAEVQFLSGGATLERIGTVTRLYEGLPPYMSFSAPSGFLGRIQAQAAASLHQFPSSLKDWGDEHKVAYLFSQGFNLVGNLVFGEAPLEKEMRWPLHSRVMPWGPVLAGSSRSSWR